MSEGARAVERWQWAEGPLLDALYEDPLPVWRDGVTLAPPPMAGGARFPLLGGLGTAVGAPRLRMLATEPCEGDPGTGACSYGSGG